jgi:microcystin-dependent protein
MPDTGRDPFLAEIMIFPYLSNTLVPTGWARCDGQLLPLSQNTALFSLLGTNYGGNGKTTFALPDLQDRIVVHPDGSGGSVFDIHGAIGGSETVTLLQSEIPVHNHTMLGRTDAGEDRTPAAEAFAKSVGGFLYGPANGSTTVQLAPEALAPAGGDFPHNNMMPYATVNYCIALQGIFPQRP